MTGPDPDLSLIYPGGHRLPVRQCFTAAPAVLGGPAVLRRAAVPAGPRGGVRGRARSRRRRDGPAVVRAGKLLEKKNTFTDFIAVARHPSTPAEPGRRTWWPPQAAAPGTADGRRWPTWRRNCSQASRPGAVRGPMDHDPLDPSPLLTAHRMGREWATPRGPGTSISGMKSQSRCNEKRRGQGSPAILAMTSLNDTRVLRRAGEMVTHCGTGKTDAHPKCCEDAVMTAGQLAVSAGATSAGRKPPPVFLSGCFWQTRRPRAPRAPGATTPGSVCPMSPTDIPLTTRRKFFHLPGRTTPTARCWWSTWPEVGLTPAVRRAGAGASRLRHCG